MSAPVHAGGGWGSAWLMLALAVPTHALPMAMLSAASASPPGAVANAAASAEQAGADTAKPEPAATKPKPAATKPSGTAAPPRAPVAAKPRPAPTKPSGTAAPPRAPVAAKPRPAPTKPSGTAAPPRARVAAKPVSPGGMTRRVASQAEGRATALRAAVDSARVPAGLGVAWAPVARLNGVPVVGVNDLARLLGATKFWRADVRKIVLRSGEHRLAFTVDNPFVLIDDRTVQLEHMVVLRSGELQIPVEFMRQLPQDGTWPRLAYDADSRQLRIAPAAGFVGAPRVETRGALTVLVVPSEHAGVAAVTGQSRARFRLRVAGALAGALPDSLPDDGLVRDLQVSPVPGGLTLELALDPAAVGWRLERDPVAGRIELTFGRIAHGFQPFATEGAPGPRLLRTVVLDPGHGGSDVGVREGGVEEKALTLELARMVAEELLKRGQVRALLTRRDDQDLTPDARAETANRAHADAVLSLHFETLPDARATGRLAWCPPARPAAGAPPAAGLVALLPWRDIALERAVESRGLAESVTAALERRGFGPTRVRERLPLALVGVQAPGVLLECGTLTNADERARLLAPGGLRALAVAIAEGVLSWQRNP